MKNILKNGNLKSNYRSNTATSHQVFEPPFGPIKPKKLVKFKTLHTKLSNTQAQDIIDE